MSNIQDPFQARILTELAYKLRLPDNPFFSMNAVLDWREVKHNQERFERVKRRWEAKHV